jgi:hypothetical protein
MKQHHNPIFRATISRVRQLLERFEESKAISHAATKGSLREGYLKDFLATFVPTGFAISSGFITDSKGEDVSPQLDLLVFDHSCLPSVVMSAFCTVVPLEASRLAIEVKSMLKQDDFAQIKTQQETIRKMRYSWTAKHRTHLMTSNCLGMPQFIAAFETSCSQDTLQRWFDEEPMLEIVCIIGKFCLLRDPRTRKVELIAANEQFAEVMYTATRLQSVVIEGSEKIMLASMDTPRGKLAVRPDFGGYLVFDVPDTDHD